MLMFICLEFGNLLIICGCTACYFYHMCVTECLEMQNSNPLPKEKQKCNYFLHYHSLIRGVLIQSCSAGAKNFTNYVFCHPQFSGVIQNIENHCAIKAKILKNSIFTL